MCIKKAFNILLFLIFLLLCTGCVDKERLNPIDPLSANYKEPTWVTNLFIILDYENTTIIDEDTTWGLGIPMPSPIKIIQNVLVTGGATLTILPGTEVEFIGVGIDSPLGIIVDDGKLIAVATKDTPVTFTAMDFTAAYVVFRDNSVDYNSVLQYCDLRSVFLYLIHQDPAVPVNNIVLKNNWFMYLFLWRFPAMEIRYNTIIKMETKSSPVVLKHNLFYC